jgi:hypothetical protein
MRPPLPSEADELKVLARECGDALVLHVEPVLEQLRSLQRDAGSFNPGRLSLLDLGGGRSVPVAISHGIDPRRSLNTDVREAAVAVGKVVGHFDLPDSERANLRATSARLASLQPESQAEGWDLRGLWVFDNEGGGQGYVGEANEVLLVALIAFFERAASALGQLRQRIERRLSPPRIRDRVQVDLKDCVVKVDGLEYQVTENQAILFHQLAQLNENEALSGTEIGARAHVKGTFKAGLYRRQIKKAALKRLIPDPSTTPGRKFRLVLPPLTD